MRKTKFAIASLVLADAAAASVLAATPAQATIGAVYTTDGVYIRAGSSTSYTAYGMGYRIQPATATCIAVGQNVNGYVGWIRHTNNTSHVAGYSSAAYMVLSGSGSYGLSYTTTC